MMPFPQGLPRFRSFLVVAVLLVTAPFPAVAQVTPNDFDRANQLFAREKYSEAAGAYRHLVESGFASGPLFFNLATSLARADRTGEAILWFRRTLVLAPSMPEPRQSLAFLRAQTGMLEFAESNWAAFLRERDPATLRWAVSVSAWLSVLLLTAGISVKSLRSLRPPLFSAAGTCLVLAVALGMAAHHRHTRFSVVNFATVIGEQAVARTAPAPGAEPVIELPPGSEVRILRAAGPSTYVHIPGDLRGWVRSAEIEPVWPLEKTIMGR